MRFVDLTSPIHTKSTAPTKVKISRINHSRGAKLLALETIIAERGAVNKLKNIILYILGIRKLRLKDFPDKKGLAWENIVTMTHRGTHMDAPYHFGPEYENTKAKTIDQIPLEWCYGDGVILDFAHKKPGELIAKEDIFVALANIDYSIKPFDIVFIRTGCDRFWDQAEYMTEYPGLDQEALRYLLEKGVKIIGVDSYSLDRPSFSMAKDYFKNGRNKNYLWPTHFLGREMEYCHIEQIANLDKVGRPTGFKVCCFPMLIEDGSAGWTRVVAILDA